MQLREYMRPSNAKRTDKTRFVLSDSPPMTLLQEGPTSWCRPLFDLLTNGSGG